MNGYDSLGMEVGDDEPVERGTKKATVPGASAPSLHIPSFVNSWTRLLKSMNCNLSSFVQSMLSKKPHRRDDGTLHKNLWPIPIPYPEAFSRGAPFEEVWRKKRLCLQLATLDWLWLGRPSAAPDSIMLGRRLSSRQWRVVTLLESLADDLNSIFEVDAKEMGRAAIKVERQDEELFRLHRVVQTLGAGKYGMDGVSHYNCDLDFPSELTGRFGSIDGDLPGCSNFAAKKIESERLEFDGKPCFRPELHG